MLDDHIGQSGGGSATYCADEHHLVTESHAVVHGRDRGVNGSTELRINNPAKIAARATLAITSGFFADKRADVGGDVFVSEDKRCVRRDVCVTGSCKAN